MDRCREMAQDFRRLERVERPVQKIALVGEIYTKYCRLGNWDLRKYLAREHCQVGTGGITWYALYYMDSHALKGPLLQRLAYRAVRRYLTEVQRELIAVLRGAGFETLPPLTEMKREAEGYAPFRLTLADGWLISAEIRAWAKLGYRKILCIQPFACLPGHIFGSTPASSESSRTFGWSAWTTMPASARARSRAGSGCCWTRSWMPPAEPVRRSFW